MRPHHRSDSAVASRVVYRYHGGASRFGQISTELMAAVDKADSARYSVDDILDPRGWTLLKFIMDARTGLGRFHDSLELRPDSTATWWCSTCAMRTPSTPATAS